MTDKYLAVDIDNVVALTDEVMRDIIKRCSRDKVDLRYEDVQQFEYEKCVDQCGKRLQPGEWKLIHNEFSQEENILRIKAYPNIEVHLQRLSDAGYEVHLVTSRLERARVPIILWLDKHRIPHSALHFVKHGTKHIIFHTCAAIIEEDLDQARKFAEQGIQSYLLAHPWNDCGVADNIMRVRDWHEIVDDLIRIRENPCAACTLSS